MARYEIQFRGNMGSELQTDSRDYALKFARDLSYQGITTVWDNANPEKTVSYLNGRRLGFLPERAPVSL